MSNNRWSIPTPKLLWRHFIDTEARVEKIIGLSNTMYEIVYSSGYHVIADVIQGVVYSQSACSRPLSKGYCIEGARIVDASGERVAKIGFDVRRVALGRRLALLIGDGKVAIFERLPPTKVAETHNGSIIYSFDTKTLAVVYKRRREYVAMIDSVYGFTVEKLKTPIRKVTVSNGCATLSLLNETVITNGLFSARLLMRDVKPLASTTSGCLVAVRSKRGWSITLVSGTSDLEPIGFCSDEPKVVYSDEKAVVYLCGGSLRLYMLGSSGAKLLGECEESCIATPWYTLIPDGEVYKLDMDGCVLRLPKGWVYITYRDNILVITPLGLYALNLNDNDFINVETMVGDETPLRLRIEAHGYTLHKVSINGDVEIKGESVHGSQAILDLTPKRLAQRLRAKLSLVLAPPILVTTLITIELPPPSFNVKTVYISPRLTGRVYKLHAGDNSVVIEPGKWLALIVVSPKWHDVIHQGTFLVHVETGEPIEVRAKDVLLVRLDSRPLRVELKGLDSILSTRHVEDELVVDNALVTNVDLQGFELLDVDKAVIKVDSTDFDDVLLDNMRCGMLDETTYACLLQNIYNDNHTIAFCKKGKIFDVEITVCEEINAKHILEALRSKLLKDAEIHIPKTYILDSTKPLLRANISGEGYTFIKIESMGKNLYTSQEVIKGSKTLRVYTPLREPSVIRIRIATQKGVVERKVLAIPASRPNILLLSTGSKVFAAVRNAYLLVDGEARTGFIEMRHHNEFTVVSKCGDIIRLKPVDVTTMLTSALRTAMLLRTLLDAKQGF